MDTHKCHPNEKRKRDSENRNSMVAYRYISRRWIKILSFTLHTACVVFRCTIWMCCISSGWPTIENESHLKTTHIISTINTYSSLKSQIYSFFSTCDNYNKWHNSLALHTTFKVTFEKPCTFGLIHMHLIWNTVTVYHSPFTISSIVCVCVYSIWKSFAIWFYAILP